MSDYAEVVSCLARMRESMLKAHPEWLSSCCSDVLECALRLEEYQKELEESLRTTIPKE